MADSAGSTMRRASASKRSAIILRTCAVALGALTATAGENGGEHDGRTATPIKHLIVVIGENRSFDHVFATYRPHGNEGVANLLSRGIIDENGRPGPNFGRAAQSTVSPQPKYFIDAPDGSKTAYVTLPPPDLNGVPQAGSDTHPPPFATVAAAAAAEPSLKPADAVLLTTGASGLAATHGPDTRIANVTFLPNGPFQFTARDPRNGQGLAYDAYTEDTIHRFFQMWQQSDCAIRHARRRDPVGCLSDLYPFVATTFLAPAEQGSGSSMGFFNMHNGDAPYLKSLADKYTLSDNYH